MALDEIRRADRDACLLDWLAAGVGLVEMGVDWQTLAAAFRAGPPIFARHICPVQATLPLVNAPADLASLEEATEFLLPRLDPAQSFSVQTRLLGLPGLQGREGASPYGRFDVNQRLAARLEAAGVRLDVRRPEQVLSVVCTPTQGFLGLSPAADNLSDWAGGMRRFKRESGQISRAEFKLLEALELFGLALPVSGMALDLGAAPGGWTRILRRHAMQVVAVDPANLHPLLVSDPAVIHRRQTAQDYLPAADQFDIILNDMRLDARDSARLMLLAAGSLKSTGAAVMTLKLPGQKMAHVAAHSLKLLRQEYRIVGARQLFHNRREITVALRKSHSEDLSANPTLGTRASRSRPAPSR